MPRHAKLHSIEELGHRNFHRTRLRRTTPDAWSTRASVPNASVVRLRSDRRASRTLTQSSGASATCASARTPPQASNDLSQRQPAQLFGRKLPQPRRVPPRAPVSTTGWYSHCVASRSGVVPCTVLTDRGPPGGGSWSSRSSSVLANLRSPRAWLSLRRSESLAAARWCDGGPSRGCQLGLPACPSRQPRERKVRGYESTRADVKRSQRNVPKGWRRRCLAENAVL